MPKPFQRRMKRIQKRVSKGTKLVFKGKKKNKLSCPTCSKPLFGSRDNARANRKFGGSLCSKCSRRSIIDSARKIIRGNKTK